MRTSSHDSWSLLALEASTPDEMDRLAGELLSSEGARTVRAVTDAWRSCLAGRTVRTEDVVASVVKGGADYASGDARRGVDS